MDISYRNRDPLPTDSEYFLRRAASDLDLDADEIIVYPVPHEGGVYTGREDGKPVIGLSGDSKYIIAHELGHDRYSKEVLEDFREGTPELDMNGRVKVETPHNDHIDSLINEIFAENVAATYFGREQGFERSPLESSKVNLEMFQQTISRRRERDYTTLIESGPKGQKYFQEPRYETDYHVLKHEILDLQDSGDRLKQLLANTWEERIHKCHVRGREDILFESIEKHNNFDYEDVQWHQISEVYQNQVEQIIDENITSIALDIIKELDALAPEYNSDIPARSILDSFPTSSPSHFSSAVQSGNLDVLATDYDHHVGNHVGVVLNELGVDYEMLENNSEDLREIGQRSLDMALEMGKNSEYNKNDFDEGVEYLARNIGLI